MRIGLVGPARGDLARFREAAEFLLDEAACDELVYLGADDVVDRVAAQSVAGLGGPRGASFEDRALELAASGTPAAIEALLEADLDVSRLQRMRTVPVSPARAVEMLEDRILLFLYDKNVLDEDDIANAHLIAYGNAKELVLRRFGPRIFFAPGPLDAGKVGILEVEDEGRISISAFDLDGTPLANETLGHRAPKLTVAT